MKCLRYKLLQRMAADGTPVLSEKTMTWSVAGEDTARQEAWNGEYEIFDDGLLEPEPMPGVNELLDENEDMRAALGLLEVTA